MPAKASGKEEITPRSTLTHIDNWRLGQTLGRGAYGHVRLATHVNGRKAACKILPALHHDRAQPITWDQTVDATEAHKEVVLLKALSGLKMPGVVELEGIVEQDGWTYMFTTLHPHSASHVQEPWEHTQLVTFFRRLCMTVHSLHALGVSHEDLKRSNVLVDPVGCPSLIDFGFSHFAAYGQRVRSAGGTLDYSSPQKVEDRMYYGAQNDVWSLGIFLAKILHIPHPFIDFDSDNESTAKKKIVRGIPDFHFEPHHMGPGRAASLIIQMLDPDAEERITIPEILDHPFLAPYRPDPVPFHIPSYELPSKLRYTLSPSVIQDICFLAYSNHEFALCETSKAVVERLYGPEPCWEKRWAKMLSRWKRREDMDWEDIPRPRATARSMIPVRSQLPAVPKRTVLRDIAQTSRVNTSNFFTHKNKATALLSPNAKAKHAHENLIPEHDLPSENFEIFSRAKRYKKPPANLTLSPRKGTLPEHETATQSHVKVLPQHASPKKPNDYRADHRAHRRALAAAPREHRRYRGASLLSEDSVPRGYPVLQPTAGTSNLITLDEAGPSSRPFVNAQHPPSSGDLPGDSVDNMRDLALEHSARPVAGKPRPPPRRSSRIAEKKVSRVIR